MQIRGHNLGICSWSLKPTGMKDLVDSIGQLGLEHVQLALGSILALDDEEKKRELELFASSGLKITAGMIGFPGEDYSSITRIRGTGGVLPDETWEARKNLTIAAGKLAQELGVKILTAHAGFIPASNHSDYAKILERVGELAKALRAMDVTFALETGQEGASELLQFLNDLPSGNVLVNFDPANMVLYGTAHPIESVKILSRHICHVHV